MLEVKLRNARAVYVDTTVDASEIRRENHQPYHCVKVYIREHMTKTNICIYKYIHIIHIHF